MTNNYFKVCDNKYDTETVSFFGQIGTYWKEGSIDFDSRGMTDIQREAKISSIVENNKVFPCAE